MVAIFAGFKYGHVTVRYSGLKTPTTTGSEVSQDENLDRDHELSGEIVDETPQDQSSPLLVASTPPSIVSV